MSAPHPRSTAPRTTDPALPALSPRQLECLQLAAQGMTSPQIARALGMSARTVNQHFAEACRRLGARNRTRAVAMLAARGLVTPLPPQNGGERSCGL